MMPHPSYPRCVSQSLFQYQKILRAYRIKSLWNMHTTSTMTTTTGPTTILPSQQQQQHLWRIPPPKHHHHHHHQHPSFSMTHTTQHTPIYYYMNHFWNHSNNKNRLSVLSRPFSVQTDHSSEWQNHPTTITTPARSVVPSTVPHISTTTDTNTSSSSSSSQYDIRRPLPGTGFDNFLPKKDRPKPSSSPENSNNDDDNNNNNDDDDDDDDDNDKKDSKRQKQDKQKRKTSSNNNDFYASVEIFVTMAIALYLVADYIMSRRRRQHSASHNDDDEHPSSDRLSYGTNPIHSSSDATSSSSSFALLPQRDITWHDFLRLLQQRDIQKVVIMEDGGGSSKPRSNTGGDGGGSNQNDKSKLHQTSAALVYLTPNATGLTASSYQSHHSNHFDRGNGDTSSSSSSSLGLESDRSSHPSHVDRVDHWPSSSGLSTDSFGTSLQASPLARNNNGPSYRLPIGNIDSFERKLDEAQRALGRSELEDVPIQYLDDTARNVAKQFWSAVFSTAPTLIMFFVIRAIINASTRGAGGSGPGNIFSVGKSTAKKIKKEDISITFADVAGCEEAKKEIMEFVDFLKDSGRFTKLGAKIPKGALLCGPPGTGKTLLAKAVAGEAGVPFYSISGSDFIEMYVGVGPSRVRDLFNEARTNAPCIVFIDEIDAVGRQRGRGGMGGNDERENTLNQLLVEMDGFSPSTGVVVLAATNRVDVLDQALTRPGRFDRQVTIDKPDLQGRKEIFKVHLKGITLENNIEDVAGRLAGLTPGFAGADISNICNEAAIVAARRKAETVSFDDFEKATDRIIGGLESNKIMSKEERSIVAHHEAGHAVAGWFLEHADALLKVTIIPRTSGALGFAQYLPKEVFLRTQKQIMDIVCMALAGRAAEEIFFGSVTTGASDDLKRVTQLVYSTIQLYGMNSRLGQLSFPKDPNAMFDDRPYSEKTAKVMDEEARAIVDAAYERTLTLLRSKKDEVAKVAQLLLDRETITHDDLITLIGERPFKSDAAYDEYIRRRHSTTSPPPPTNEETTTDNDNHDIDDKNDDATTIITPNLAFKG